MSALQNYENKTIAIYGMGLTGISVAKALKRLKSKIECWDDKKDIRDKAKKLNLPIRKFWTKKKIIDSIIISPGIDINKCKIKYFLKKNIKKIKTDLDLFFEFNKNAKIIAITGTNGKSTTCKVIEKILKTAKYNVVTAGNIGNPILSFNKKKKKYIFIFEISSYQLQYSKLFRSTHAAILNISPDHLERHGSIENYVKVKTKIFFAQKNNDYSYINDKNKYSKKVQNLFRQKGIKSKLIKINKWSCKKILSKINNKYFKHKGNLENLAFAYIISKKLKINDKVIIKAVNKFKGLSHRQEVVFSNKKILCINDSKATSFDASLQSLSSYKNIYWIVGGLPKFKDKFYFKSCKKNIFKGYIIGKNISFFKKKIKDSINYSISKNIGKAVNNIYTDIKKNKNFKCTILFSPAAASFDQFKNFEARGSYFKKLVKKKFKTI